MPRTKNLPVEITSLEDFVERALSFDFYTDMSDDHRVYSAGRRNLEIMNAYAAENPVAKKLWDNLVKSNSEMFFSGQLIHRVENAVFDDDKLQKMRGYAIKYLAAHGSKTMIGASMRNAIAKKIGAPPSYAWNEKEKREKEIDEFIESYERG